ncbi:hypothetical protein A3A54_01870 [Candidatus Curtissbacteria bacterium RIFCSPLOWO2_01_FULL_39_62]|uniref:GDT1 family protein n=2 Tax=Candidatus Curtissiibacteriota TaxID=1752717 RepID=A0A1F5G953_9BACT|nr:MAG: hypothetical protein A2775_00675 [Candidatus Curtissbacteria bacterium RIFCSPHIGHO2_01_FULL_39_57]OGD88388.1 MAG: hypothetical protein A3D04_02855 [Candidatus Curtissbacteria bacterium RIFCSPHIGHO2_02_FULL_40_16b]OGD90513.1 MAG: hypothetical protein A3E11_02565 [Candidatus Curtissbacteria bacterium RIFCSPHIGHO2_12_FULL_38_37]OGD99738.1 MAG: hypothetical protein A3J17_00270 [Candidatus Curtissbacteria bacterium RIFCSPLOWO2_02_FULL_40_11]OGE00942.1 MAG: hypothetical protein A3A54_01870 [C
MFSIFFQQFIAGFFVKALASFDDTLTRVPLIAEITGGKLGKIAFSIGTLLALTVVLLIAVSLSAFLNLLPFTRLIIAGLILLLAVAVYFEVFIGRQDEKLRERFQRTNLSRERFIKLIGIGFLVSLITLIDDSLVLASLFIGDRLNRFAVVIGIYAATLVQITVVIYFGEQLNKFRYKKEVAVLALVILAMLILIGII